MVARRAHNPKVIGSNPIFTIIIFTVFMKMLFSLISGLNILANGISPLITLISAATFLTPETMYFWLYTSLIGTVCTMPSVAIYYMHPVITAYGTVGVCPPVTIYCIGSVILPLVSIYFH